MGDSIIQKGTNQTAGIVKKGVMSVNTKINSKRVSQKKKDDKLLIKIGEKLKIYGPKKVVFIVFLIIVIVYLLSIFVA
ncbi:MAG: hypothetical protein WC307_00530 [Candidatus Nanoarchaeia archaeon]|jgi:hypothetical protein